jgi:hypothetical protein
MQWCTYVVPNHRHPIGGEHGVHLESINPDLEGVGKSPERLLRAHAETTTVTLHLHASSLLVAEAIGVGRWRSRDGHGQSRNECGGGAERRHVCGSKQEGLRTRVFLWSLDVDVRSQNGRHLEELTKLYIPTCIPTHLCTPLCFFPS